ncbi:hypothetical protein DL96DRAFT_1710080 [Flagelloscypha sp. PMI_526]|nr:hypothetical protein DL96DRAFT_1710080 [Flagelloscypha sp. PMI_526]
MDFTSYLKERDELIQKDTGLRRDYALQQNFSDLEKRADQIVRRIRKEEAETIWDVERDDVANTFPGMAFLTSKSLVMETNIFKLLTKMPKGALLHAHFDATVDPNWVLKQVYKYPAIYSLRVPSTLLPESAYSKDNLFPLTTQSIKYLIPEFSASRSVSPVASEDVKSISDESYERGSWINLVKARENFSAELGGTEGFDEWIISHLSISPKEAYETHSTDTKIWTKFGAAIGTTHGLIAYEPVWKAFLWEFLRSSVEDGVSWIEERLGFPYGQVVVRESTQEEDMAPREIIGMADEVSKSFKEDMKKQGREKEFFGYKVYFFWPLPLHPLRILTEKMEDLMTLCIDLKKEYPHLIAGFDLVGPENAGHPLIHYAELLLNFRKKQAEEGVDIPFIFHAGETVGDGTDTDKNLYDAILLGTKRIGHGFSLIKHPELIKLCRERNICIEMCPISNEILRLTTSMPMHPLPALYNNGVPIALSSDDPSVFGNMGLSYDYFQVLVSSEISGLLTMAEIARDSIRANEEKSIVLRNYDEKWKEFVEFVNKEQFI